MGLASRHSSPGLLLLLGASCLTAFVRPGVEAAGFYKALVLQTQAAVGHGSTVGLQPASQQQEHHAAAAAVAGDRPWLSRRRLRGDSRTQTEGQQPARHLLQQAAAADGQPARLVLSYKTVLLPLSWRDGLLFALAFVILSMSAGCGIGGMCGLLGIINLRGPASPDAQPAASCAGRLHHAYASCCEVSMYGTCQAGLGRRCSSAPMHGVDSRGTSMVELKCLLVCVKESLACSKQCSSTFSSHVCVIWVGPPACLLVTANWCYRLIN